MRLPAVDLSVGNTVGDYEIVALLGRGGMGRVFKVRNLISDRVEAMKSLLSYADAEPELAERFAREIKVLAKLEHPNITSFRTAFRAGNELLMIMEYVEGCSLDRKLAHERLEMWRSAVPPINVVPDVPQELSNIIQKTLEKKPIDRFQTADDLRTALQDLKLAKPSSDIHGLPTASVGIQSHVVAKTPSGGVKSWDTAVLETARKNLAVYIGPMAKVIVSRAAAKARSLEGLYQLLAAEIPSLHEREKFLRSRPL
jgi:serine/threonine protein kinase